MFPNGAKRAAFDAYVGLMNRVEDLPRIRVRNSPNRAQLEYWCIDYRRIGLRRLVESCGGTIVSDLPWSTRFEEQWMDSAVALS